MQNNMENDVSNLRSDLNSALHHLHQMCMQTKYTSLDVTSRIYALLEELIANGQIDLKSFEKRRTRIQQNEEERAQTSAMVYVDNTEDKYKLENIPEIDCASRIDLCKARCCQLFFTLSFQDLDEGIVKWEYAHPYQIKKREDGYCTHHAGNKEGCRIYENRPAVCRMYDCRKDNRIWIDFEKRIIAPIKEFQERKVKMETSA